jgi:SAM-dependent methyltransferase
MLSSDRGTLVGLARRVAGRARREAIWHLGYRWNPLQSARIDPTVGLDVDGVRDALRARGIPVEPLRVSLKGLAEFIARSAYPADYHDRGGIVFAEKTLEHHLSLELLGIGAGDTYIDLASDRSPFPAFVRDAVGCRVYVNDLGYPPGVTEGGRIGSDASRLPLPDGSISRATLHCSLEHFEGDADVRLVRELGRVLAPGGRACILPLYLHTRYVGLTDPLVDRAGLVWDPEMATVVRRGYGQRHGRFYDVARLEQRILSRLGPLRARLFQVENLDEVAAGLWCHWVLLLEKDTAGG